MLDHVRIDLSEGIDVNETTASKECNIFQYWCFVNYCFKLQPNVCLNYHDLLMMPINLNDIAI